MKLCWHRRNPGSMQAEVKPCSTTPQAGLNTSDSPTLAVGTLLAFPAVQDDPLARTTRQTCAQHEAQFMFCLLVLLCSVGVGFAWLCWFVRCWCCCCAQVRHLASDLVLPSSLRYLKLRSCRKSSTMSRARVIWLNSSTLCPAVLHPLLEKVA